MGENYEFGLDSPKGPDEIEIENAGILKQYRSKDIEMFVHDLILVFHILTYVDQAYGQAENIQREIDRFKKFIEDWNKKYRDIILSFHQNSIQCYIKIFFKTDMDEIVQLLQSMRRVREVSQQNNDVEASYDLDRTINTVNLISEEGMMRMIFAKEDMLNPKTPEFKLATYFGLKGGFSRIDLQTYKNQFSFSFLSGSEKDASWFSRYPALRYEH